MSTQGPASSISHRRCAAASGLRYWYSQSHSDLDNSGFDISSTDNVTSHTAELVGTLEDTTSNTFFRGYVGLGRSDGGDVHFSGYEMDETDETRSDMLFSTAAGALRNLQTTRCG